MNVQEIKKAPRPRYSGILVHPTSFPSPYGIGDLGDSAYAFIRLFRRLPANRCSSARICC